MKIGEVHFVFSMVIVLVLGFFLGQFFGVHTCMEQCSFNADVLENCNYDKGVYYQICGDVDQLMDDSEKQLCIEKCSIE